MTTQSEQLGSFLVYLEEGKVTTPKTSETSPEVLELTGTFPSFAQICTPMGEVGEPRGLCLIGISPFSFLCLYLAGEEGNLQVGRSSGLGF